MLVNYISKVYDLTQFGIFKINNAIVGSDLDSGISIEVSFDGGATFLLVNPDEKFHVNKSTGKIQVRISFLNIETNHIYMVKTIGFFQNLEIGTTIYFTKKSTKKEFKTTIKENGKYSIELPRGIYDVWYINDHDKISLINNFNPEIVYLPQVRIDKENSIELYFRDIPWAKYTVFDTFVNNENMKYGNAIIDVDGDLSDGVSDRKCKYWSIHFD